MTEDERDRLRLEALTRDGSKYLPMVEAGEITIAAAHAAYLADADRAREEAYHAKRIAEQDARIISEAMLALQFLNHPEARLRMLNHRQIAGTTVRPLALEHQEAPNRGPQ